MTAARLLLLPVVVGLGLGAAGPARLPAQRETASATTAGPDSAAHDSVTIRVVDIDLRAAVQIMGQYLDRPVVFSGATGPKVTLETPHPVPKADVVRLLRGLLESQNYDLVADSAGMLYRALPRPPPSPTAATRPPRSAEPTGAPELFVIALKHARAADVARTVDQLYGQSSSFLGARTRTLTLGDQLQANQMPPVGAAPPSAVPGTAGRSAALSGPIAVVPDAETNSLLIRANRTDFQLVQAVVAQLDVRPLQVLIEVLIAEVSTDHSLSIGNNATLGTTTVGRNGATIGGVLGNGVQSTAGSDSSTATVTGLAGFALTVMGLGGLNLNAQLQAAADRGTVKILSRPVLLAANNQRAEISVGSQRPFVQISQSLPTGNGALNEVVQYKDVGTKLTVTPTISADGLVQLDVTQEVSNATTETAFNAPVISTRSIQTQLLVRDNQTVALGGLSDKEDDADQGGVPLLSALPIIGGLFGHASRQSDHTELFIFLTPHVIRSDEDAAKLAAAYQEKAKDIRP